MGPLTLVLRLPILPLQGFLRVAELLHAEAERQLHSPAQVRRQLEEAEQARAAGTISEDELSRVEHLAVARLSSGRTPAGRAPASRPAARREGDQHG